MRVDARAFWLLLRKDLLVEGRARELLPSMAVVVLLLLTLTGAAGLRAEAAPVLLWLAVAMGAATSLVRSFHQETDQDQLHGLRLAGVDPAVIFLAKATANFLIVAAVEAIALAAALVFFDVAVPPRPAAAGVLLLGTAGLAAAGTLLGAMLTAARLREALLPVLLLPLAAPALGAAASATARLLSPAGGPVAGEIRLLAAFTVLFTAAGMVVFDALIEA